MGSERMAHARRTVDMAPHVDSLCELARGATVALDLGVRTGVSTWALLDALPEGGVLWSVDREPPDCPARVTQDPRWRFVHGDDNDPTTWDELPDHVDFVFLDTSHEYPHTLHELRRCAALGPGIIALHDWALEPVQRSVREFLEESYYVLGGVEDSEWGMAWLTLDRC